MCPNKTSQGLRRLTTTLRNRFQLFCFKNHVIYVLFWNLAAYKQWEDQGFIIIEENKRRRRPSSPHSSPLLYLRLVTCCDERPQGSWIQNTWPRSENTMTSRHGILEKKQSAFNRSGANTSQRKVTWESSCLPGTIT